MAIAGTKIGTGYVSVEPDWSGFQPAVERGIKSRFQKIGDDAGRALTDNVNKRVRRDRSDFGLASPLASIVNRFKKTGDEAGRAFSRGASRGAAPELSNIAKAMQKAGISLERSAGSSARAMRSLERDTFGVGRAAKRAGVDLLSGRRALSSVGREARTTDQATHALTGRLRSLGSEMRAARRAASAAGGGFRGFDGGMARVNRSAQFFRNILRLLKWPVLIAGVGLFAQGVSALAAGFVAATSALGPLTGALVALPAAALVAAQAFGVLKLATAGVGDAVKAALTAEVKGGAQAVDTLRQQEAAAERVADAKRNLTDVQKQAKIAQEDLTDARSSATRELQDMRLAAEGSHDAEQQGHLSLIQARKDLAKTLQDPAASGLDVRFAEEAVDQARRDLEQTRVDAKRAREDYSKAQKGGIEKMPEVVAAKRAEEDANRSVADAQRDLAKAVRDNSDAMKDQGSAATALQEKMSQLPKAGQRFVHFLVGLKPRLDTLRETAAGGFFPGAEEGIRDALKNFGVFRGIVDGTSKALGRLASKAGKKLGSDVWGKDLGRLGKLNTRIIGRLGDSLLNVGDAFRNVLVSAEPFLDWLSKGTEKFSEWLSVESEAGRKSGALAEFFDRTRETMERVWPILKGIGGALLNIGEAARPLGNEILDSLGSAAEGWRKWTDSTKGKNRLKQYFTETKPAIFEMGRLVRDAGKAFFELGKQKGVATLLRLIRTELIPALRDTAGAITGWAAQFIEEFGSLRKEGVPTFDAFVRTLADHAGQAGFKIAKALGGAFLHASIWGKLAISGFLLARFGGLKALAGMGARMGASLGKSLFKSAAAWIAGTETGASLLGWFQGTFSREGRFGKASRAAGVRMGKLLGRGLVIGFIAGLALAAPAILEALDKYIGKPARDWIKNTFGKIPGVGDALGEFFTADLFKAGEAGDVAGLFKDKKVSGKLTLDIPSPKVETDKAKAKLRDFSKSAEREGERARKGFKNQVELLPGIAGRSAKRAYDQTIPRLGAMATDGGEKGRIFRERVGGSFGDLAGTVRGALVNIEGNVGNSLKGLSAGKAPHFNLKMFKKAASLAGFQEGGMVPAFATGGLAGIVPGDSTGDRHTLSINGRPVAKVESKEGIFVGNRNLMGALSQANAEVPRFQKGGQLGKEPILSGPTGSLRKLGQSAISKVFQGAKDYLAKHMPSFGGLLTGSGNVERIFASVAKKLSTSKVATLALGEAGFAESGMRDLGYGDSTSQGSLQLLASTAASTGIDPHDEAAVSSAFLLNGYTGKGGANRLAAQGLPAHLVAQGVQGSAFSDGSNYLAQEGPAKAWMKRFRLQAGGLLRGAVQRLASGGMVDPSWDSGGETIAGSIAQLVAAYAKRYDIDITAGYDPGGGHVSPGHNVSGTATDVVPRDGNWDGAFAKGLETLAKLGFEVGYDGSIPGTESWPGHGRGNHAHIEWVGNGTAPDSRQRLREYLGGVSGADSGAAGGSAVPKERVPTTYQGAKTGNLNLGPMPKDLDGANKQLNRLGKLAPVYRKAKAHAEKSGKPATAQAIGRNLSVIEERLKGLRSQQSRLRLAKARKAISKRLGKALGRFGNYDQIIEGSQLAYERASQDAEQIVGLEPQSPELPASATDAEREAAEKSYVANFTGYVNSQERPAYARVLDSVAQWRNNILRAEKFGFGKGQPSVSASQTAWEGEARTARNRKTQIDNFSKAVKQREAKFKEEHPKAKELPKWLQEQIAERDQMRKELPFLELRDSRLTGAIIKAREMFFPGGENRLKPPPTPLPFTGSLEDRLKDVQGIHGGDQHELLSAGQLAPPRIAGRFGGAIWDLQETIEGLGLKISQAANSLGTGGSDDGGEESSVRAPLLEELLRQANQRTKVSEGLYGTLRDFDEMRKWAYAALPKFHTGGVIPGGPRDEVPILARGAERIRTPEQELALAHSVRGLDGGRPAVQIEQLIVYEDGTAMVKIAGEVAEVVVERHMTRRSATGPRVPGGSRI